MDKKSVLIIEDNRTVGEATKILLSTFNLNATWVLGLRIENPFEHGRLHAYTNNRTEVDLDLATYAVALVDGSLVGGGLQGWDIIPILRQHGIFCVGLSGEPGSLEKHSAAGANLVLLKPVDPRWFISELPRLLEQQATPAAG